MSRVFLDANVLFSAAITPEGVARAIFELALQYERSVSLIVTEHVLREALANMERKYPRSVTDLLRLLDGVEYVAEPPRELLQALRLTLPDPRDVPVLAGAVYAGAEVLVTGDRRHFGELYGRNVGGCVVLPPREALSLLESRLEG